MITVINTSVDKPTELSGVSDSEMVKLSFGKAFSFNYDEQESQNSSKLQEFLRYVKSSIATTLGKYFGLIPTNLSTPITRSNEKFAFLNRW